MGQILLLHIAGPANTLILDFWYPELQDNNICWSKAPSLLHFVMGDLENECNKHYGLKETSLEDILQSVLESTVTHEKMLMNPVLDDPLL